MASGGERGLPTPGRWGSGVSSTGQQQPAGGFSGPSTMFRSITGSGPAHWNSAENRLKREEEERHRLAKEAEREREAKRISDVEALERKRQELGDAAVHRDAPEGMSDEDYASLLSRGGEFGYVGVQTRSMTSGLTGLAGVSRRPDLTVAAGYRKQEEHQEIPFGFSASSVGAGRSSIPADSRGLSIAAHPSSSFLGHSGAIRWSRPQKCSVCGDSFATESALQFHMLSTDEVHTMEYEKKLDRATLEEMGGATRPEPVLQEFEPTEILPPVSDAKQLCGFFRGIQGENNSCYIDVVMMVLFVCDNYFDDFLCRRIQDVEGDARTHLCFFKDEVINSLRSQHFVERGCMLRLRDSLSPYLGGLELDAIRDERDMCESMDALKEFLDLPPMFETVEESGSLSQHFVFHCVLEGYKAGRLVSEEFLHSLGTSRLVSPPERLFITFPRVSRVQRTCRGIIPEPYLNIPKDYFVDHLSASKVTLELYGIVIIKLHHYLCFFKCQDKWLFYDSMAKPLLLDKSNVPQISKVARLGENLADAVDFQEMLNMFTSNLDGNKDSLVSILDDTYAVFYRRVENAVQAEGSSMEPVQTEVREVSASDSVSRRMSSHCVSETAAAFRPPLEYSKFEPPPGF